MKVSVKSNTEAAPDPIGAPIDAKTLKAVAAGSAEELIAEFDTDDDMIVHEVEILGRKFYIRELDIMSMIDIETQRLTVERGEVVRKPNREAKLGLALEFSGAIMRRAGEIDGKPVYEPMFTLDTVQTFLSKPKAMPLINQLADAIYRINPALSPAKKVRTAKALR